MRREINPLITFFSKTRTEDGSEYFTGSINPTFFKKSKGQDIEVVLMPTGSIPESLMGLLEKSGNTNMDLLMFGILGPEDKKSKGR